MDEKKKNTNEYEGPPIVMDLVVAYKQWYGIHQHLPKLYRITISHQMLITLSNCIEYAVIANFAKKNKMELEFGKESLLQLRGKIELIKAYALVSWEMVHYLCKKHCLNHTDDVFYFNHGQIY